MDGAELVTADEEGHEVEARTALRSSLRVGVGSGSVPDGVQCATECRIQKEPKNGHQFEP